MANRKQTHKALQELRDKYFSLVWYARTGLDESITTTDTDPNLENIKVTLQKIREKYPQETAELITADAAWHHGFNSGMLAAMRHSLNVLEGTVELANSDFPNLDT